MNKERITVFGIGSRTIRILSEQHNPNLSLFNVDRKPPDTDIPGVQYICSDNITEQPLRDLIHCSDMVIVIADLSSKLTTEVVPIIGFLSKQSNKFCLTFGVQASLREAPARIKRSDNNLALIRESVNSIIIFVRDKPHIDIDYEIAHHIQVLAEAMRIGCANIDVHLLKTTLKRDSYIGFGSALVTEEHQANKAVTQALSNVILLKNNVRLAKNVLIYIKFNYPVELEEVDRAFDIAESSLRDADVSYGFGIDNETDTGELSVLILGSGFEFEEDLFDEVFYF